MKIELVRPHELGRSELAAWRGYERDDARFDHPFLSSTFAKAAGEVRPRARIAVFEDAGTPVAFLPLSVSRYGIARSVAPGFANCEAVVHQPDFEWAAIRPLLTRAFKGWQYVKLLGEQARHLGPKASFLEAPTMDLSAGWPAYLAWARGTHPKSLKNASGGLRRLREQYPEVEFRYHDSEPGALAWLLDAKAAQCYRNGWRDIFVEAWVRELIERLVAEQTVEFGGAVTTLRANGEIVAAAFGVRSSTVHAGSLLVHAPQFSRFNPGWVCLLQLGEAAAARGLVRHDLGDGAEPIKVKLGNARIQLGRGAVGRSSVLGRVVLADEAMRRGVSLFAELHSGAENTARQAVRRTRRLGYAIGAPLAGTQGRAQR